MVRGKFKLDQIINDADYKGQRLTFKAVSPTEGDIEENTKYHKYTPSGSLQITVDNPPAQEQLILGKYYYLDLTPVPEK